MTPRAQLAEDGFTILRSFYEYAEWEPLEAEIGYLIAMGRGRVPPVPLDAYTAADAALVLEGAKQLPSFHRLITKLKNLDLISDLRPGFFPGIAEGGPQIRADMPGEEKWRTPWHQEFPFQGRSQDGIVFWIPLLPVSREMGPVEFLVGSHKLGPLPIYDRGDGGVGRTRSYVMAIENEADLVADHGVAAPLLNPGDLLVSDYLTIHRSGQNTSRTPRFSALWRYFNYRDEKGIEMGWKRPAAFGPTA